MKLQNADLTKQIKMEKLKSTISKNEKKEKKLSVLAANYE